jgi:hypothetical protein
MIQHLFSEQAQPPSCNTYFQTVGDVVAWTWPLAMMGLGAYLTPKFPTIAESLIMTGPVFLLLNFAGFGQGISEAGAEIDYKIYEKRKAQYEARQNNKLTGPQK